MSSPATRIEKLINTLNLNPRSFAIECGYEQPTTIYSLLKRNGKPSKATVDKICFRFKNVNREWLIIGQGEMFLDQNPKADEVTVTAKQTLEGINRLLINKDVFAKNLFDELNKKIDVLSVKLSGIEIMLGLEVKQKLKKKNGI